MRKQKFSPFPQKVFTKNNYFFYLKVATLKKITWTGEMAKQLRAHVALLVD